MGQVSALSVSGLWTSLRVHLAPRGIAASPRVFPGVPLSSTLSPQRVQLEELRRLGLSSSEAVCTPELSSPGLQASVS